MYTIQLTESFQDELLSLPKKVIKKFKDSRKVLMDGIESNPNSKKLKGFKELWRYRLSDSYRLIFKLDKSENAVTLIKIGHRKNVYESMNYDPNTGPSIEIIASIPEVLEPDVVAKGSAEAIFYTPPTEIHEPTTPLPFQISKEFLEEINVPSVHHAAVIKCKTEEDVLLLEPELGDKLLMRLLNAIYPVSIEQIAQQPVRIANDSDELDKIAEGTILLSDLLLKLDSEQNSFVQRFKSKPKNGPWLIKGGPGSGKSTVALHCINELINPRQGNLLDKKISVLFTTYTNSLVNASRQLINKLNNKQSQRLTISTMDKLVWSMSPGYQDCLTTYDIMRYVERILSASHADVSFKKNDAQFIADEIEWVIYGNGINSLDSYVQLDRTGRGKPLREAQRKEVWKIFSKFDETIVAENKTTFKKKISETLHSLRQRNVYDYVFIDEAQDLTPQAIRLCIEMCKSSKNIFITADSNQTIYGAGFSWAQVHNDLQLKGRTRILKKNYRTTREIMTAIADVLSKSVSNDIETLKNQAVKKGDTPVCHFSSDIESEAAYIKRFIHDSAVKQKCGYGGVGVLCYNKSLAEYFAKRLQKYNAKFFEGKKLDLDHPGVKVMTMHSSKGLQFPIVVVPRIDNKFIRWSEKDDTDSQDRKRRLLFVACSRAVSALLLTAIKGNHSPLLDELNDEHWEIIKEDKVTQTNSSFDDLSF